MSRNLPRHTDRWSRHAVEPLERRRLLAGIALDLNYGADGRAILELGTSSSSNESVQAAVLQPGGRVLMVGSNAASEMVLVRLTSDGTRDPSFGVDGVVRYGEAGTSAHGRDVLVLPDGRLLVAGFVGAPGMGPRLLRYFANGRLDASFGNAGVATAGHGRMSSVALLPDGKILAAGATSGSSPLGAFWRFHADGSPDASFGTGGFRTVDLGGSFQEINDLTVLPDGRFLAHTVLGLARFAPDGTRDLTFAGGASAIEDNLAAHARQPDGSIVTVRGVSSAGGGADVRVARYSADGILDASFGQQGAVTFDFAPREFPATVALQPDGKILIGGRSEDNNTSYDLELIRLHPDGTPDATFGTGGVLVEAFSTFLSSREEVIELLPVDGHTLYAAVQTSLSPDTFGSSGENFAAVRYPLDVPLNVDPGGPYAALDEGGTINVSGAGSSYPGGSIVSYEWAAPYRPGAFRVVATGASATVPAPDGPRVTVALRVTTSDGLQAIAARDVTVNNVAPTVDAPANRAFAQGVSGEFTGRIIDPGQDQWTMRVDFGDGTPPVTVGTASRAFTVAHAYAQGGTFPVSIRVSDEDGGSTTFDASATVAQLAGRVFRDHNDSTLFDSFSDEGFAGQTVYVDLNDNAQPDGGEPQATTTAGGDFAFDGLAPGAYRVRVVPPAGWRQTGPAGGYHDVTVAAAQGARADFAFTRQGRIAGTVFDDANANGLRDPGEGGRATARVYIDQNNDGFLGNDERWDVTDSAGAFELTNVAPGTYAVRLEVHISKAQTAPAPGEARTVVVEPASVVTPPDWGACNAARVTGLTYEDRNRNGVRDPGELDYLVGAYADLNGNGARDAGEPRSTFLTGATYAVPALPPGTYQIRMEPFPGLAQVTPANNAPHVVTVGLGQVVANRNFGFTFDDFVAPGVSESAFLKDVVSHQLRVRFGETVTVAPPAQSLVVTNLTTGQTIANASVSMEFDIVTNTATYTFPGLPNATLADGRYRATILAAGVEDFAGNRMAANVDVEFHVLAGDADGDGAVNLQDFNRLAAHFGAINRVFSEGDFNYDGVVNLGDFNVLAARFGAVAGRGLATLPGVGSRGRDDDDDERADDGDDRSDAPSL